MKKMMSLVMFMVIGIFSVFAQINYIPASGEFGGSNVLITILGLIIGLVIILFGIFTISKAEYYLAIRETAMNTRKEIEVGPKYDGLKVASIIIKVLGYILIVFGVCVIIVGFISPF